MKDLFGTVGGKFCSRYSSPILFFCRCINTLNHPSSVRNNFRSRNSRTHKVSLVIIVPITLHIPFRMSF